MSHEIEMAIFLLGPLTIAHAEIQLGRFGTDVEESAQLLLKNSQGSSVGVNIDFHRHVPERTVLVVGDKGEVRVDFIQHEGYICINDVIDRTEFPFVDTYEYQAKVLLSETSLLNRINLDSSIYTVELIEELQGRYVNGL